MKHILHRITSIMILTFGLLSCKPDYDKIFIENRNQFEIERSNFNKIVADIEKQKLIPSKIQEATAINIAKLELESQQKLKDLGITGIILRTNSKENCYIPYTLTFHVHEGWNISDLKVVQIIYSPCDNDTNPNYHHYDGYHMDTWGMGDNWSIFSDTDFI